MRKMQVTDVGSYTRMSNVIGEYFACGEGTDVSKLVDVLNAVMAHIPIDFYEKDFIGKEVAAKLFDVIGYLTNERNGRTHEAQNG